MMTEINKVFVILYYSAQPSPSEIEDVMHNWKVFINVINKDCLYFTSKTFIVVVIIRDETKRIVLNIFTTVNKIYNEWVYVLYSLLQW